MNFLKLTGCTHLGSETPDISVYVWFGPGAAMIRRKQMTEIWFCAENNGQPVFVRETPEQILAMFEEAANADHMAPIFDLTKTLSELAARLAELLHPLVEVKSVRAQ